jgi:N6-L-threonylcarbamoyladenine synthase
LIPWETESVPVYLGVESSCDETAAAVVRDGRAVLSNCLLSQIDIHKKFGGVVPEVAARAHLETINHVIAAAMLESGLGFSELDGVAFTAGPGLVGTLLTGMMAAKSLAWAYDLPLIAVDHLLAHVAANFLATELSPPFVALLVSGGHTQIIHFQTYTNAVILGKTLDDAAGEAYDKVARLLGLAYPGGAVIDRLAQTGNPNAFKFPEGVVAGYNFSFSGLKTAVLRCVQKLEEPLPVEDISASFQEAVTRVLVRKTLAARDLTAAPSLVLAGGVAANKTLRARFDELSPVPVYYPRMEFCTDNAAMVAAAAHFCGKPVDLSCGVYSRAADRDTVRP